MKTKSTITRLLRNTACFSVIAATLAAAPVSYAEDSTNQPDKTNSAGEFNVPAATNKAAHDAVANKFGLPKEAFDKLNSLQIMELATLDENHGSAQGGLSSNEATVALMVPVAFFATVVGIILIGVSTKFKRSRLLHETIRLMIEKGQPIPPELLQPDSRPNQSATRLPASDLRRGLVFIALGIGLLIVFHSLGNFGRTVGWIPILMGVAFLIAWKLESNKNNGAK